MQLRGVSHSVSTVNAVASFLCHSTIEFVANANYSSYFVWAAFCDVDVLHISADTTTITIIFLQCVTKRFYNTSSTVLPPAAPTTGWAPSRAPRQEQRPMAAM